MEFGIEECTINFCPPPWLDNETRKMIKVPGIIDVFALDELRVRFVYDPTLISEEAIMLIFEEETGLTVTR